MASRVKPREEVKHLFECFCEVSTPKGTGKGEEAKVLRRFPESFCDADVLKTVPQFVFPCDFQKPSDVVQHFSFVLTSSDSTWTFGFCRLAPVSVSPAKFPAPSVALVLLSHLPWHEVFYKLLNQLVEVGQTRGDEYIWSFLDNLRSQPVPDPGAMIQVSLQDGGKTFVCQSPRDFGLPSIPDSRNLTEYVNAVDSSNMLVVLASLLSERRVIIVSSKLSRLSACVQAAEQLLYPMCWQHIFIPVLPETLSDYLLAPMPYLVGVPHPIIKRMRRVELGEVVIVDADHNTVETPFKDVDALPQEVVSQFKRQLRSPDALLGEGVPRAFLRALVQLMGGYRDALRFHQGARIEFDADAFVRSRPPSLQPFLRSMLQLQIFRQFVEERLDLLNSGHGFTDEFELEAYRYSERDSRRRLRQQYREWMSTVKKEGGQLFKTVKQRSKLAYKDIKSKLRDLNQSPHPTSLPIPSNGRRSPNSAPSSPTGGRVTSYRKPNRNTTTGTALGKSYSPLHSPSSPEEIGHRILEKNGSSSSSSSELRPPPLNLDLMGDLSRFLTNNQGISGPPPIDRTLKPCPSFDEVLLPRVPSPPPRPKRSRNVTNAPLKVFALPAQNGVFAKPSEDLICLESLPSDGEEEFDPLKRSSASNPSYELHTVPAATITTNTETDLLREYGLDFSRMGFHSTVPPSDPFSQLVNLEQARRNLRPAPRKETWTTFD